MKSTRDLLVSINRKFFAPDGSEHFGKGWPKNPTGMASLTLSMHEALTRRFDCPAYFVGHEPTAKNRRIGREVLTVPGALAEIGGAIRMHLAAMDADWPDEWTQEQKDAGWEAHRPKLEALRAANPGIIVYRSTGGYRILGALPEPFLVIDAKTSREWGRKVITWFAYLKRAFGLGEGVKLDQLTDWARYQRVPHDRRKQNGSIAELELLGDVERIGFWAPVLDVTDVAAGALWKPEKAPTTKAAKAARAVRDAADDGADEPAPAAINENPAFLAILLARGSRCEQTGSHSYDVDCPSPHPHSGDDGKPFVGTPGKTFLYTNGTGPGHFHCMSAGCAATFPTAREQWAFFTPQERSQFSKSPPAAQGEFDDDAADPDPDYTGEPPDNDPRPTEGALKISAPNNFTEQALICSELLPTLVRWRSEWYAWTGTRYELSDTEHAKAAIRPILDRMIYLSKKEWWNLNPSIATVNNVVDAMIALPRMLQNSEQSPPFRRGGFSVDSSHVITFQNGSLDLRTGGLNAPDPDIFSLVSIETAWDSQAQCPEWLAFLDLQWADSPNSKALLQEWFGYCLTSWFGLHKMLFMKGPKRSGKGTTFRVLEKLLGEMYKAFDVSDLHQDFALESFIGRRVVGQPDVRWAGESHARTLGRLLMLSGGDGLLAQQKNKPTKATIRDIKVMMGGNEWPSINDRSGALPGRLLLLEHTRSFMDKEDLGLEERLLAELPGIAAWAVEGLRRLMTNKRFTVSEAQAPALVEIEESGNTLLGFFKEELEIGAGKQVSRDSLRSAYVKWAKKVGVFPLKDNSFGKMLREYAKTKGVELDESRPTVNGRRERFHVGVCLVATGARISRSDLVTVRAWVNDPKQLLRFELGIKQFERFKGSQFSIADALLHALEIPKERHPQHEDRISDVLAHLGYTPDEDDLYTFKRAAGDSDNVFNFNRSQTPPDPEENDYESETRDF